MKRLILLVCGLLGGLIAQGRAATLPNPILFVTQAPIPGDFTFRITGK